MKISIARSISASLSAIILAVVTNGCRTTIGPGGGDNSNDGSGPEDKKSYSYSYSYNGCETGNRTFNSKDAYCKGLLDEELNNGCAASIRYETYKKECGELPQNSSSTENSELKTQCGDDTCGAKQFCLYSKSNNGKTDLVPPKCVNFSETARDKFCDDALKRAKA